VARCNQPIAAIVAWSYQYQHTPTLGSDPFVDGFGHSVTGVLHHLIKDQPACVGGRFNAAHFFSGDDLQRTSLPRANLD
jgi:hypothetical protein